MDLGGDFGPAAVAVDAAVGAHHAEDRVAGEGYVVDGFNEGVEGRVQTFAALQEQAGGAGVAVDGAIVIEIVVLRELPGGAPVNEFLFDRFAFGVVADDAAAAVSFEEEDLQLFLQAALTVDSVGFLSGVSWRFFCWLSLLFSRSWWVVLLWVRGRRTRARGGEAGDRADFRRTTFVRQRAPADFGSVASLAPFRMTPIYIDGRSQIDGGCLGPSNWKST